MLTISRRQIEPLRQAALEGFVSRTLRHVETHFAQHWRIVGELMRVVIHHAMERARRHGLTTQRDVCLYLNLMLLLGSAFDADPQLPWAARILSDPRFSDPRVRIDTLYDAAADYLDKVAGVRNEHRKEALGHMAAALQRSVPVVPANEFGNLALSVLRWMHPRKFEAVGEGGMRIFARQSMRVAQEYGVASHESALLHLETAYMFGSGFDRDPQFPWAGSILRTSAEAGAAARFERLRTEALSQLSRWTAPPAS